MLSSFNPGQMAGLQGNQGRERPSPGQMFDKLDTDKSGSLTASELEESKFGARLQDAFADIDTNGDAALTTEELRTFRAENGPPPPPPGGGMGSGRGQDTGSESVASLFQNLMTTLEAGEESSSDYATNVLSAAENLYAEMRGIWAS